MSTTKNVSNIKFVIAVSFIVSIISLSCKLNNDKNSLENHNNGVPQIQFDTTYYDFGNLIQGEKAAYTFKFKNTGTADLLIHDAYSTCGCAVPSFSKEPIKPGDSGTVDVTFNSEGKRGLQYKTVTLKLNTRIKEKSLMIKANVIVKENYKS